MTDTLKRLDKLSPEQRKLAQLLLEERRKQKSAARAPAIPRRADPGPIAPLSFGQQRLWFLDRWDSGSAAYNLPQAVRLKGRLDINMLRRSLNTIVSRHEVLRTRFTMLEGQPVALIAAELTLDIPLITLQEMPAAEQEGELRRLMDAEARQPFDLATGPLLRAKLIRLDVVDYLLLLTLHHSVSDGWSNGVLVREIGILYQALAAGQPAPLPELPIQYADFAAWQREWLQGEMLEKHLAYWRAQIDGAPTTLPLPLDRPRPAMQTSNGARYYLDLPAEITDQLKHLSQREGASLFMTLLAAFGVLLARYTDQRDILVGSPVANRNRAEIEPLIGFFVNTLVLRVKLGGRASFRELIRQVRDVALGAQDHQDLPFEKLVEELNLERDMSRNPLFQVMFTLQNAPLPALTAPDLTITPLEIDSGAALVDLSLDFYELAGGLRGWFEYNTDLFDAKTIVQIAEHFVTLVSALCANPDQPAITAAMLSAGERARLLEEWNATGREYSYDRLVHQLFAAHAARTPAALAVVCGEQRYTYRELDQRANQIDRHLRGLGIRPGMFVGICMDRSPELLASVLGVLKTGAAYVPLDPNMPRERIAHVLADTGATLVLAGSAALERLPEPRPRTVVIEADAELAAQPGEPCEPPSGLSAEHPAYVIYTSGSTGRAKGVIVSHRNMLNAYLAWEEAYQLDTAIRSHSQMASFSFDVWAGEMLRALCSGGKLVICPRDLLLDAPRLFDLLEAEQVACAEFVPVVLRTMLHYLSEQGRRFQHLRLLICGSERWYAHEYHQIKEFCGPDTRVLNSYGLTETTIDSAFFEGAVDGLTAETALPIGRPLPNTTFYILDDQLQPVPVGVHGELYIGGTGVAMGYLGRPDLTAERFIPNPFTQGPGARGQGSGPDPRSLTPDPRLYRTGDLARYLRDGNVEVLGRIDTQIKVRGFRVEPGEIEAALCQHSGVQAAAVVGHQFSTDDTRLVAYIVPTTDDRRPTTDSPDKVTRQQGDKVTESPEEIIVSGPSVVSGQSSVVGELRAFLAERLPDYMIPAVFMPLDRLPTTNSGKLDRKALPPPDQASLALNESYTTPRNTIEDTIAGIWAGILEVERVGIFDNFFELGGHSLLATYVMSRIQSTFEVDLPLRALFDDPTVAGLGARVEQARTANQGLVVPPIEPQPQGQPQPLSLAQERLWFVDQLMPGNVAYISTGSSHITGPLDPDALETSFNELIRRHAILRTNFVEEHGRARQIIVETQPLVIERIDLRDLPQEQREQQSMHIALEQARYPFDLGQSPLIRLALVHMDDQEYFLHMATHHIIYDLLSMSIFIREIRALYEAAVHGRQAVLPELPIQYADFAAWQDRWMRQAIADAQVPYWKQQLSGATMVLDLPSDRRRPAIPTFRGARLPFVLSAELSEALKQLSNRAGTTMYMTLLAAFNVLLYRYSGQEDIIVGSPTANRSRAELENLIGFFVNTLTLRTRLDGNPTFRELLGRVRETALGAYTHQDLPFPRLVEAIQPQRDLSRNPIFQVMFNFLHNYMMPVPDLMGIHVDLVRIHGESEQFDLSLDFWERPEGLNGSFDYTTDLFDEATIVRMKDHMVALLTAITANPDQRIANLAMLGKTEQRHLLHDWNGRPAAHPSEQCVHQLFEAQADRTPAAIALIDQDTRLTYAQLNERANQLAHHLRRLGVGPDSRVAICVERSPDMITGLLGILKAGGAYIPLDPAYPQERLVFMLEDSRASVLITHQEPRTKNQEPTDGDSGSRSGTPWVVLGSVVDLVADWPQIAQQPTTNPEPTAHPDSLAYVIYTSGSTGRPKGVMIPHRALASYTCAAREAYRITPEDRVLQFASINFDTSAEEIYPCLASGAALVLRTDAMFSSSVTFLETCRAWEISVLDLPTAYWHELTASLQTEELAWPEGIRLVIIGGERALPERLADWHASAGAGATLVNTYGPTETTIVATMGELHAMSDAEYASREVSIGQAVANARVYILDSQLQLAPIGVPGELYIGGAGMARGYLGRPDLTAERFIPDPFLTTDDRRPTTENQEPRTENRETGNSSPAHQLTHSPVPVGGQWSVVGGRLYKTGDLARYRADGSIEFVGRNDDQVKLRGFRIELGEIEAALRQHPAIHAAAVIAREDTPGNKRLVAYLIPNQEQRTENKEPNGQEPTSEASGRVPSGWFSILGSGELRAFLKERLPAYMIPAAFVFMEALPSLPNGKLDRRALPAPDGSRPDLDSGFVAPRNATEEVLAGIWAEFLQIEQVGVYDNFFELGGHSLLATQVISQIRDIYQVDLSLQRIFREPTVAGLSGLLIELVGDPERLEQTSQIILQLAQTDDDEIAEDEE